MAEPTADVKTPESAETQAGSSPEEKTLSTEPTGEVSEEKLSEETPKGKEEEKTKADPEFVRDPGSRYNKRIRELLAEKKALQSQLDRTAIKREPTREQAAAPSKEEPKPAQATSSEIDEAVQRLKDLGFPTRDEIVTRDDIKSELQKEMRVFKDRLTLDTEYDRLEKEHTGKDGRPSFDRKVIEDYSIKQGIYNPEAAYEHLYRTELMDWAVKDALKKKKGTYVEKPGASPGKSREENILTPEKIRKMSPQEYERRREEIKLWVKDYTLASRE